MKRQRNTAPGFIRLDPNKINIRYINTILFCKTQQNQNDFVKVFCIIFIGQSLYYKQIHMTSQTILQSMTLFVRYEYSSWMYVCVCVVVLAFINIVSLLYP